MRELGEVVSISIIFLLWQKKRIHGKLGLLLSKCVEMISEVEGGNEGSPMLAQYLLSCTSEPCAIQHPPLLRIFLNTGIAGVIRATGNIFTLSGLKTDPNFQAVGVTSSRKKRKKKRKIEQIYERFLLLPSKKS